MTWFRDERRARCRAAAVSAAAVSAATTAALLRRAWCRLGIPGTVFACGTEPVVVTRSPHGAVTPQLRPIESGRVERRGAIDSCRVVAAPADLETALDTRLKERSLAWTTSSS